MASKKGGKGAGDGSNVPTESAELDGAIVTAAQSTMVALNLEKGYSNPEGNLHMAHPTPNKRS